MHFSLCVYETVIYAFLFHKLVVRTAFGDGVVVNVSNDYTKLERRMDANSSELKQIKKILKQQGMYNEKMFISHRI